MYRVMVATTLAVVVLFFGFGVAQADDYTVPIYVSGKTHTLTVTIDDDLVTVTADSPAILIGNVTKAQTSEPASSAADPSLDAIKANAVTIPYDDLFRNNEQHVGKAVRYVGEVVEYKEKDCLLCDDPGYVLRVEVTENRYGYYDDPIWVEYENDERFLVEDIVTVWGTVEGLESYVAVLGNEITIPKIQATEIVLGEDSGGAPVANVNANLRGGPGTNYPIVGSVATSDILQIAGRNADGTWFQLDGGEWIAGFLVDNAPTRAVTPLIDDIPATPAATTTSTESGGSAASTATTTGSSIYAIGEEIQGEGWRFKVSEVHKRKALYFYDDSYIAMGYFLIVILDAVNEQSGTDYFERNIDPYVVDDAGNTYRYSTTGASYARWQFGGLSSPYGDVNPGNLTRIPLVYDMPPGVGNVMLSTGLPAWVELGNFAEMELEE